MSAAPVIAASVLAGDLGRLADEVAAADRAGADWIHLDVMDGHFVPNLTFGPATVAAVRGATDRPFDVHLMVSDPDRWITAFAEAGADWIGVQAEAPVHLHRTVQTIGESTARASVALNPATPLTAVEHVLDSIGMVLVMTVNPGFSGQDFIAPMLEKVRRCRLMIDAGGHPVRLAVDGGVDAGTIARLSAAGADTFVAGSAIMGADDRSAAVQRLRDALGERA